MRMRRENKQRDRQTDTKKDKERESERTRQREWERHRENETNRDKDETERQTDKQRERGGRRDVILWHSPPKEMGRKSTDNICGLSVLSYVCLFAYLSVHVCFSVYLSNYTRIHVGGQKQKCIKMHGWKWMWVGRCMIMMSIINPWY